MKTKPAAIGIMVLSSLFLTEVTFAQTVPFSRYVKCNGERLAVLSCFNDDDQSNCMVVYPDRPLRHGFEVQEAEKRGDVIAKIKACLGPGATLTSTERPSTRIAAPPAGGAASTAKAAEKPAVTKPVDAGRAEAYADEGSKYCDAKDYAKALDAYQKAVAVNPSLARAYEGIGLAYDGLEERQLAVSAWKRFLELEPNDANVFVVLGNDYRELKQYDEALKAYRSAIADKPKPETSAMANFWIGNVYFDQKQYQKAVPALQEAFRLQPADDAAFLLGQSYMELKQYEKALEALQQAVRLKPDDPDYQCRFGYANLLLGKDASAVAALQQAIRLKPDYAECYAFLGLTYVEMGNKEQALQVYRKLQTMDKEEAQDLLEEIKKMK